MTLRGTWYYVPFVLEEFGRPGHHALAFLRDLETHGFRDKRPNGPTVSLKTRILQNLGCALHGFRAEMLVSSCA